MQQDAEPGNIDTEQWATGRHLLLMGRRWGVEAVEYALLRLTEVGPA